VTTRSSLEADLAARLDSATEARWMVEEVLGRRAAREHAVSDAVVEAVAAMADRRLAGEPLQYVLGTWAFRTLELTVDPRVLIPRPETEHVVEVALRQLRDTAPSRRDASGPIVADLGTGSGAIALSIAAEVDDVIVWATDADRDALAVAAQNRARVGATRPEVAERVRLRMGDWVDWFGALPATLEGGIDLVVTNPPYVSALEWIDLEPSLHQEPRSALVADDGSDGTPGFAAVEAVLRDGHGWLVPGGSVVVEIAEHQAHAARTLAGALGYRDVRVERDLAGRDRVFVGRR